MRIKPMYLIVAVVLCMTQMVETTTALQHQDDQNHSKFPQEVVNNIARFLNSNRDKRDAVLDFLSDQERKIVQRCTKVLRSVIDNDKAFQGLVYKLAEDIDQLKKNSDYLMDMAEYWNNDLNHQDDRNHLANLIPQDIMNKIAEYLTPSPKKLVPIMIFFSLNEEKITKRYVQTLRTVLHIDAAFRDVVDNLVKDTEKIKDNPEYYSVMADIWNYYLKNVDDPQQKFEFESLLSDKSLMKTSLIYNFLTMLSNFAPTIKRNVLQLTERNALAMVNMPTLKSFNQNFDRLFRKTNLFSLARKVQVGLVVTSLTLETYDSLNLWWKGEISGKRCAKNVIDSCASVVGGIYGGTIGAAAGTCIAPGPGTIIGGLAGGIAGSVVMHSLSDWLTQYLFDLPKDVALENAYRFMQLDHKASNDEINSNYNRLAWEYHPKVSKNVKNWLKLQTCMDVIRTSKGQELRDF